MTHKILALLALASVGCSSSRHSESALVHEPPPLNPSSRPSPSKGHDDGSVPSAPAHGTNNRAHPERSPSTATPNNLSPEPPSFTWNALQLETRPTTHLATGKRRAAAIVQAPEQTRELVVHELPLVPGDDFPRPRATSPLPAELQSASLELRLFMGRDDWPRVIAVPLPGRQLRTYLRFRPDKGWESPLDEQGALAALGRANGYYGVLGHLDPEILCVGNFACYEKRNSGWKKRPVPGLGSWSVVVAPRAGSEGVNEAWAWPNNDTRALLKLSTQWEPWAQPPEPVRQLVTWNGRTVLLTTRGLHQGATNAGRAPSDNDDAHGVREVESEGAPWVPLVEFEGGTTVSPSSSTWLWVGTNDGLFKLDERHAILTRVHLKTALQRSTVVTRTCCILPLVEPSPRSLWAGAEGLFVLERAQRVSKPGTRERSPSLHVKDERQRDHHRFVAEQWQ
jgi:hypothetical protein